MTLFFPDVSQYTPNVDPAAYPALLARATLSDRVADPTYAGFKAKAQAAGTVFGAYHWLNHGNLARQAQWCFEHVGGSVPLMIDAEDVAGNTGYAGPLTVADLLGFADQYRSLGGIVSLVYLPFWYWSGAMGAPHQLDQLAANGLHLVSSNYPNAGYTETGPGWAPYYSGAPTPVQWQYTSTPIDMNAFRGTVAEFAELIGVSRVSPEFKEVPAMFLAKPNDPTSHAIYLCDGFQSYPIPDWGTAQAIVSLGDTGALNLAVGNNDRDWAPFDVDHPRMIRNGWTEAAFGRLATGITDAQLDALAAKIAALIPAGSPTAADIAKAVNDDAKTRRETWA